MKRKQKMGGMSTRGLEVAILKQMVRDHVNRKLKSRRNSKLKGTKQDYVSWIQSRAMRPEWLEQVRRKVAERWVVGVEKPDHIGRL